MQIYRQQSSIPFIYEIILYSFIYALVFTVECPFHFDFAIFIAGFKSRSEGHSYLYDEIIQIPTLHVYGETDKVIEKGKYLLFYFSSKLILCNNNVSGISWRKWKAASLAPTPIRCCHIYMHTHTHTHTRIYTHTL